MNVVHACDERGIKRCGDTVSGDQRQNVDKYPEQWSWVTCLDCIATRDQETSNLPPKDPRYAVARKIVEMTEAYEAGQLKRTARDFISGMVKAYGMFVGTTDVEVAYKLAKVDAARPYK